MDEAGVVQLRILPATGCEKFAEYLYEVINEWAKKYHPHKILFDKYATQTLATKLEQSGWPKAIEKALEMEREQHGETWDAALIAVDRRGGVLIRALMDFDKYWEKRNTSDSEGVSQPEAYPEGRE